MDTNSQTQQEETQSRGYRILSVFRTIFVYLVALGLIVAALMFAASSSPNKSLFGIRYYTVLTPSMEPVYSVGDMVFVQITRADAINVGDVITFNPASDGEAYLTHRVVEKFENYQGSGITCFRTKGDANNSEDSFLIDEDRVIGVVRFCIPKLGYVVRFVQLRWYYVLPLIVLVFIFFKLIGIYLAPAKKEAEEEKPKEFDTATVSEPQTVISPMNDPPNE